MGIDKKMILKVSRDLNKIVERFDKVSVSVGDMRMASWEYYKNCEYYVITEDGLVKADWEIVDDRNWLKGAPEKIKKSIRGYINVFVNSKRNAAVIEVILPETF